MGLRGRRSDGGSAGGTEGRRNDRGGVGGTEAIPGTGFSARAYDREALSPTIARPLPLTSRPAQRVRGAVRRVQPIARANFEARRDERQAQRVADRLRGWTLKPLRRGRGVEHQLDLATNRRQL